MKRTKIGAAQRRLVKALGLALILLGFAAPSAIAQKKVDEGMVALVNVRTDYRARFSGVSFSDYST